MEIPVFQIKFAVMIRKQRYNYHIAINHIFFLFFCNIFVKNICFSTVFCYVFHNFKKFSTIVLTYFIKFCYYMKSIKYIHFFLKTLKFLFAKKMDFFTKMLQTYQHLWITLWITFVERMIKWQSIKKN